jgi:hypothetical protein
MTGLFRYIFQSVCTLIMLKRVDPLLGNDRKQTGSQGNESTLNSKGTVRNGVFCDRAATVATQRRGEHESTTIEELCFLRDSCRYVTGAVWSN